MLWAMARRCLKPLDGGRTAAEARGSVTRLRRMLAGAEAPKALSALSFQELDAVAVDCLKAAETLRWVLERQREPLLVSDSSGLQAYNASTSCPIEKD